MISHIFYKVLLDFTTKEIKVSLIISLEEKNMRLRELRNKSGLTQNEIAGKLGVSGQTILNWENGIYEPKINQLIQLADLFDVSVDYLIERKTSDKSIDAICKELERIPKEDIIDFVGAELKKL